MQGQSTGLRQDASPGSILLAWKAAVLAAVLCLGAVMWLQGLGASAAGLWPFAMIATLPLLGGGTILGRERRPWVTLAVVGVACVVYGGLFHGLLTPMAQQPGPEEEQVMLAFLVTGLVGGATRWGVEWRARESANVAEP